MMRNLNTAKDLDSIMAAAILPLFMAHGLGMYRVLRAESPVRVGLLAAGTRMERALQAAIATGDGRQLSRAAADLADAWDQALNKPVAPPSSSGVDVRRSPAIGSAVA